MGIINVENAGNSALSSNIPTYTWAHRPLPNAFGIGQAWFSDIGNSGEMGFCDGKTWTLKNGFDERSIVVIGADHGSIQHYGSANNGLSRMYSDLGLAHYVAINTDHDGGGYPGQTNQMTWDQIKTIRDVNGCDIISHGARHAGIWNELNTGISLRYVGTGSAATVAITGTYPTITIAGTVTAGPGGEDFSFDTSNALYNTFDELLAAIAATGTAVWVCLKANELPGTELSNNLMTIAAQDVKTAARRFAAGGGLRIRYVGTNNETNDAKTASLTLSTSTITIYQDGVTVGAYALSSNTLKQLSDAIDAVSGWDCHICNDGDSITGFNYLSGSESAQNLVPVQGGLECLSRLTTLSARLSNWKMLDYLLQRAVDNSAANGVTLTDFAQSGSSFARSAMHGHRQHNVFRGNPDEREMIAPHAVPASRMGKFMLTYPVLIAHTRAQIIANMRALAENPGWTSCWLMHNVGADATSGYTLNFAGYTADATEADWFALLKEAKTQVDAKKLNVVNLSQASAMAKHYAEPTNLIFNPMFINSGETLTGLVGDGGNVVPGWLASTNTGISAMTIDSAGKVSITATGSNVAPLKQQVYLQAGKTYELGVMVEVPVHTSGSGAYINIGKVKGSWKGNRVTISSVQKSSITRSEHVKLRITMPNRTLPTMRIRSKPGLGPTWDLSVNKNINLNIISIGAIDNLDCSVGAALNTAVTAYEIAAAINAAIKANATYRDYPEYHNIARGEKGRVIIEVPTTDSDTTFAITLAAATTTSATALIFGNAICNGHAFASQQPGIEDYVMTVNLGVNSVGTVIFSNPYITEVKYD